MQLNTPTPVLPFTLTGAPSSSTLKASSATGGFARERAEVEPVVPALLHSSKETVGLHIEQPASSSHPSLANWRSHIGGLFPLLSAEGGDFLGGVCTLRKTDKTKEKPKVGVVLLGGERPGTSNVLYGLVQRVCTHAGGKVVGFKGAKGLLHKDYVTVTEKDAAAGKNQPAFAMLGRTEMDELELGSEVSPRLTGCIGSGDVRATLFQASRDAPEKCCVLGIQTPVYACTERKHHQLGYVPCTYRFPSLRKDLVGTG